MIYVIKNNGERDVFDKSKIIQSCLRAGASVDQAEEIANRVEEKIYNGITTKEIMRLVRRELRKLNLKKVYIKYPLKEALSKLDPNNYEFEYFIANLFRYLGYEAIRSPEPKLKGFCLDHEIDVYLYKDGKAEFVEVKHRFKEEKYIHLDVVMYHYARFLEFKRGHEAGRTNFKGVPHKAWVVTNNKFTYHAIKFSRCYGIELMGWNFPEGRGINVLIEKYKAFPLTLFGIKSYVRNILFEKYGIIDANDLYGADKNMLRKYLKNDFDRVMNMLKAVMDGE